MDEFIRSMASSFQAILRRGMKKSSAPAFSGSSWHLGCNPREPVPGEVIQFSGMQDGKLGSID